MKKLVTLITFFLIAVCLYAQQPISGDSLSKYEGKVVSVCAKVTGTYVSNGKSKTTFINFGKPFPNHSFSVVIFENDLSNFSYKPARKLRRKNICVTGTVKIYKGKPEMIVEKEEQIRIK